MNPFLPELREADTREQLAIVWRVIAKLQQAFPSSHWEQAKDAFRERCEELGLEWKG